MQKIIYEFFPIAVFFVVYKATADIFTATLVLIITSVLQVSYEWFKFKKVEKPRLIGVILIVVLGGSTVLFHDDVFIKWKVTIINYLFALILFASYFIGQKTIIERMMGGILELPQNAWKRLNAFWIFFFLISGLLNYYFAFYYGLELSVEERTDAWVNFKFYGLLGLTFLFMILQVVFLYKYVKDTEVDEKTDPHQVIKDKE